METPMKDEQPKEWTGRDWILMELRKYGNFHEVAKILDCAYSGLYQFSRGERKLGPDMVRRMWNLINKDRIVIPERAWLEAMVGELDYPS
jgi:hypothetical protein